MTILIMFQAGIRAQGLVHPGTKFSEHDFVKVKVRTKQCFDPWFKKWNESSKYDFGTE